MTSAERDPAWGGSGGGSPATIPPVYSLDDFAVVGDLLVRGGAPWFDIRAFGGVRDDASSTAQSTNVAAVQTILQDIPNAVGGVNGGRILFPEGNYYFNAGLDLSTYEGVTLEGGAGRHGLINGPEGRARLVFTQSGSAPLINLKQTNAMVIRDLSIFATGSPTGHMVDLDGVSAGNDTTHTTFEGVSFDGGANRTLASLVHLNVTHTTAFRDCSFYNAILGVKGYTAPYGSTGFANSVSFDRCLWQYNTTAHVWNPDGNWNFRGCTIEPLVGDVPGFIRHDNGETIKGLTIESCWFGDVTGGGSASWIAFAGNGLVVKGCNFNLESGTGACILFDANGSTAVDISGNTFSGASASIAAIDFGATSGHNALWLGANKYGTLAVKRGTIPPSLLEIAAVGGLVLPTYTTATKPAAAAWTGKVIYVSDGGAGAVFQGSNGAAWVNLG